MPPKQRVKSSADDQDPVTLTAINALLEKQLQPLYSKLEDVYSSVGKLEKRLTEFESNQKEHEQALSFLGEEVADIKSDLEKLTKEVTASDVASLRNAVQQLEHDKRGKCVELCGIPPGNGENLLDAIVKIAKKLKTSIGTDDVDSVYRIKQTKRVVIRFMHTHKRDMFISECKKNQINLKDLGFKTDDRVFINEVLSAAQYQLLYKARQLKREKNYQYLWTKNQLIFLRKDSKSEAILVKSEQTLRSM